MLKSLEIKKKKKKLLGLIFRRKKVHDCLCKVVKLKSYVLKIILILVLGRIIIKPD